MKTKHVTINLNSLTIQNNDGKLRSFGSRNELNLSLYSAIAKKHRVDYSLYKKLYGKANPNIEVKK